MPKRFSAGEKKPGLVVIGRNEGQRLMKTLSSVLDYLPCLVYVDSGSTDQSVAAARSLGVPTLCLNSRTPYRAARARNAGFSYLIRRFPSLEFVQFVDGDCELHPNWLPEALCLMQAEPGIAAVSGRRRERFPRQSVFHRLLEVEWNKPAGEQETSGGDALVRVTAFRQVGGFDGTLKAGEEPELCFRLREKGWKIFRLDQDMTLHEMKTAGLSQWVSRRIRAGYAAKDIFWRTRRGGERTYSKQIRSVRLWTLGWLGALWLSGGGMLRGLAALALPLQMFRVAIQVYRSRNDLKSSFLYGIFTMLGKWPEGIGQMLWGWDHRKKAGPPGRRRPVAVIASYFPSRSETFVYREVRALRQKGWEIQAVSLRESPDQTLEALKDLAAGRIVLYGRYFPKTLVFAFLEMLTHPRSFLCTMGMVFRDFLSPGEKISWFQRGKFWVQGLASLGLAFQLRRIHVGHVHASFAHAPATLAMYTANQLGLTFSFKGHANDLFERQVLLRKKLQRAAFVSCISRWHQEFYESVEPSSRPKFRLIRYGVDTTQWRPRRESSLSKETFRLITVCRLVEKKGVDLLIQAMALLHKQYGRNYTLKIIGDGPERERLEALARREGVFEKIQWQGWVPHEKVRELLSGADLFALPCRTDSKGDRDGIPVALIEAMACGLPVVAGDLPALRELVQHGRNGLLLSSPDPSELARSLASLAEDPGRRLQIGEEAHRHVEKEFSFDRNVALLENVFSENIRRVSPAKKPQSARYCLISPCRDEAKHLGRTLESVLGQTLRPTLWVIVDDGSSDETPLLLEAYVRQYDWIRVIRRPNRGGRLVGPGVVEAFYEGYRTLDPAEFDYLCKLDMDLELPPRYFETLIRRMEAHPRIGSSSGKAYSRLPGGRLVPELTGDEMSVGMTKFYRTACFRQIGGWVRGLMWDGIDCHQARRLGWRVHSWDDPELRFIHLRPMGSSHRNILVGRFRHGAGQYFMGTGLPYLVASAVYRMKCRPWVVGGLAILAGYLWSAFTLRPRYRDPEFRRFLKSYHRESLLLGKREATRRCHLRQHFQWDPARQTPQRLPRIGYFIPEFPGQTHTFLWREKQALAEQGIQAELVSTRKPRTRQVPHAWSAQAIRETEYLWPPRLDLLWGGLWELLLAGRRGWERCFEKLPGAVSFRFLPWIFFGAELAWLARRKGWKHLHVHSCGNAATVALFASCLSDLTYSLTLHARISDFGSHQEAKWRRAVFAIFVAPQLIPEARQTLGFLPPLVEVAPMGVDPSSLRRQSPYVPWRRNGPSRIFSCGRLNFSKGHLDLIEAVKILRDQGLEAQLFIAGGEDASQRRDCLRKMKERIRDLSLQDSVRVLGPLSEEQVREELERAQIFVSASHQEAMNVSLMEAMAMGVPVVATRVGGTVDLVEDGKQGLLVPPRDPEMLARAARALLEHPDLSSEMGEEGRRRIQNFYPAQRGAEVLSRCLAPWSQGN